ncbi:MAG: VCBS repeat-containing protein [Phycisphaerales bacterium]|nr:MAG: VCBS repeat-containing protein [Phycisphaerales bacterium]
MKSSVLRYSAVIGVLAAVFAGCASMYQSGGGGGSSGGTGTAPPPTDSDTSTATGDIGSFPDGSHDAPDSVPPSLTPEEVNDDGVETASHFRAIQIDPVLEDTAGPKFVVAEDMDNDGDLDLVTGWNQSQPVQVHIQAADHTFETINLGGTYPFAVLGGVEVADFDADGWPDIAVLVKHNGEQAFCGDAAVTWCGMTAMPEATSLGADVGELDLLFSPGSAESLRDGTRWKWVHVGDPTLGWSSKLDGRRDKPEATGQREPEWNGYTAMAIGDITCDGNPDIVVCFNPAPCKDECEEFPVNRLVMYVNPGPAQAALFPTWQEVWIHATSGPTIKYCAIDDVDGDGDLDIIFTNPDAVSRNVSWARNPCVNDPTGPGGTARTLVGVLEGGGAWEIRPVGHVDTDADVIAVGDVDGDGYNDVMVRSSVGWVVQWFKRPTDDGTEPVFPETDPPIPDRDIEPDVPPAYDEARWNFPWPVFTVKEFAARIPEGIALGDLTGDGQVEAIVAAGGAVFWYEYDAEIENGLYDLWLENFVVDDTKDQGETADPNDVDFRDQATFINTVLVVDLDQDGFNDVVGTLDRQTWSGLADDSLIWFRNTKGDSPE